MNENVSQQGSPQEDAVEAVEHDAISLGPPEQEVIETGHERDSISARLVLLSIGGVALLMVLAIFIVRGTIFLVSPEGYTLRRSPGDLQTTENVRGPRFTPDQPLQLRQLREAENRRLENYEWIDESAGTARIPIERAMEIIASQGLSTPMNTETEEQNDSQAP